MSTWRGSECCGHWREPWSWICGEGESEEAVLLVRAPLRHDELCGLTAQDKRLMYVREVHSKYKVFLETFFGIQPGLTTFCPAA